MATDIPTSQTPVNQSSLLKKLGGFFVELDETAPVKVQPKVQAVNVQSGISPISGPSLNEEMLASLQKKITSRSSPYVTLVETAEKLAQVIPDDMTRIKAAFAMVGSGGGRTLQSITQAIDVHIADLEGERLRFKDASDKQIVAKSGDLRQQSTALVDKANEAASRIESLKSEIVSLEAFIDQNTAQARDLTTKADASEVEIKSVADQFNQAVDHLKTDLTAKKSSLSSLLS